MSKFDLPTACQSKFAATSNCIACGTWVDAMVILGDIVHCPEDSSCLVKHACRREAARCAGDVYRGVPSSSRLLERLRHLIPPVVFR